MEESGGDDRIGGDEISLLAEEFIQLSIKSSMVEPNKKPTLLCTIWTEKSYNPDSFRVQKQLWSGDHGFQKNLVLFDRLAKPMERSQIRLNSSLFWIKIGSCLPEFDKKDLLYAIGVTFGGIIKRNHGSPLNMISYRLSISDVEGWGMVSKNVPGIEKAAKMQEEGSVIEKNKMLNERNGILEEKSKLVKKTS
ncbi:hypothetical protein Gogos_014013 [Gossypium gossypioides]|uniref:DUF4283 domain-containing protein n=1 Tax=Gossypium gossypioides TaxID=34282 RepID=A0A7J9BXF4_GOSGO|nr:hypothetical protein [Gossypium gossypioides]